MELLLEPPVVVVRHSEVGVEPAEGSSEGLCRIPSSPVVPQLENREGPSGRVHL